MLDGKGRFINGQTKTGKRVYDKFFVYIPTEIARDGLFPLKAVDGVLVKVDPRAKSIIIKKA